MKHTPEKNVMRFVTLMLLSALAAGCSIAGISTGANGEGPADIASPSPPMSPYKAFMPASQEEIHAEALQGNVNEEILIARTVRDFDPAAFRARGVEVLSSFKLGDAVYYRLRAGRTSFKKAKSLSRLPGIAYIEHEILYSAPAVERAAPQPPVPGSKGALEIAGVLNDPKTWGRFGHFETTGALEAYKRFGFGANDVYAAVIDTGINMNHEDFMEGGKSIVEFAKSAYVSKDGGKTFTYVGEGEPLVEIPGGENWDNVGHGTHVSGTIAALGNNGIGVAGVAWDKVKLISYKGLGDRGGSDWAVYSSLSDLAKWKQEKGITQTIPVNMSLGSNYSSSFSADMISEAQRNGILIVAAAGNDGYRTEATYPAAYQGVLAVSAVRANGEKASFSTVGNFVSVAAPGNSIYSTGNHAADDYFDSSGTSMATPFVTGLIAYMLSFDNTLAPDQIRTIIEESATDLGMDGRDIIYGHGMVNVEKAIERVVRRDIPAAGSRYATGTAKVRVSNTSTLYDSGLEGEGLEKLMLQQPVYLYDADGNYVCQTLTSGNDGIAQFSLLKPGRYTARTNFFGKGAKAVFEVRSEGDVEVDLEVDAPVVYIQTLPNVATDPESMSIADTILTLHDSQGNVIAGPYDSDSLDTLAFSPVAGKTYVLKIDCYSVWWEGENWPFTGEYGLVVSPKQRARVNSREGRGDDLAEDDLMEENDSFADTKEIEVEKEYGLYLGDSDYFRFTWNPAQAQ